jgi:glycosyltransferase involved in cell wall biosynthesis
MKLLVFNHHFGSEYLGMEFRTYNYCKELQKYECEILISTATYSHLRRINFVHRKWFKFENHLGLNLAVVKTINYGRSIFLRFIAIIQFILINILKIRVYIRFRPDVIICSSTYPFDFFLAKLISLFTKSRIVFELHDLWPLSLTEQNRRIPKVILIFLDFLDRKVLALCDGYISTLENSEHYLRSRGLRTSNYVYLPNAFDIVQIEFEDPNTSNNIRKCKNIKVGYAGSFEKSNALEVLLEIAAECPKVDFLLIGDGTCFPELSDIVRMRDLGNVKLMGKLPYRETLINLKSCDILYAGMNFSTVHQYGIGMNKLLSYYALDKFVILQANITNHEIVNFDLGKIFPSDEKYLVVEFLNNVERKFLNDFEIKKRGSSFLKSHRNLNKLSLDYYKFLKKL